MCPIWLDTTLVTDLQNILRLSRGLCPEITSVAGSCSEPRSKKVVGETGVAEHTCALLLSELWHGQGTGGPKNLLALGLLQRTFRAKQDTISQWLLKVYMGGC